MVGDSAVLPLFFKNYILYFSKYTHPKKGIFLLFCLIIHLYIPIVEKVALLPHLYFILFCSLCFLQIKTSELYNNFRNFQNFLKFKKNPEIFQNFNIILKLSKLIFWKILFYIIFTPCLCGRSTCIATISICLSVRHGRLMAEVNETIFGE